jgi:hypothetical protein
LSHASPTTDLFASVHFAIQNDSGRPMTADRLHQPAFDSTAPKQTGSVKSPLLSDVLAFFPSFSEALAPGEFENGLITVATEKEIKCAGLRWMMTDSNQNQY